MQIILYLRLCYIFSRISAYTKAHDTNTVNETVRYLFQYGYLTTPGNALHSQLTDARVRDSISHLQKFAHLPVTGSLDNATLLLFTKPRCGVPDFMSGTLGHRHRRYILQGQKWEKELLTWSFNFSTSPFNHSFLREELINAIKSWSNVTNLRFQEVHDSVSDIHIKFSKRHHGDSYAFDGMGGVLAHAFFPGSGLGGDIHLDGEEVWY